MELNFDGEAVRPGLICAASGNFTFSPSLSLSPAVPVVRLPQCQRHQQHGGRRLHEEREGRRGGQVGVQQDGQTGQYLPGWIRALVIAPRWPSSASSYGWFMMQ